MTPRASLPMGAGLDRESGLLTMAPSSMEDLRNLIILEGKYKVRRGFGSVLTLTDGNGDAVTHILGARLVRSEGAVICVAYTQGSGTVSIHRLSAAIDSSEYLGDWDTFPSLVPGDDPPVVHLAESNGKVFMAHDEPFITNRAQVKYYDAFVEAALLNDLEGFRDPDLPDTGSPTTDVFKFRGVESWGDYILGWGYGTDAETREEMVRISLPGQPHFFLENDYFIAGQRRDPTIRVGIAGGRPLCFKRSETHVITGFDRSNWGIQRSDPLYGIAASRLAVNVAGSLFFWSTEGPRVSNGRGPSTSLDIPLDLLGPEPDALTAEGDTDTAFAEYLPQERCVLFFFGRRVYVLSVRNPQRPRWSYWELGIDAFSAFRTQTASSLVQTVGAPTGHPEFDSDSPSGTFSDITWNNEGATGNEILEVWSRLSPSGSWSLNAAATVSGASQVVRVTGLSAGSTYDVAGRYRRGTQYTPGYEGTDPTSWPSVSRGTTTTTLDPPTGISSIVWSRTGAGTEQNLITVGGVNGTDDVRIYRRNATANEDLSDTVPTYEAAPGTLIHTESAPAGDFTFADTGFDPEEYALYTVTHWTGAVESGHSAAYTDSNFTGGRGHWNGPRQATGENGAPIMNTVNGASPLAGNARYSVAFNSAGPNASEFDGFNIWDSWNDGGMIDGAFPQTDRGNTAGSTVTGILVDMGVTDPVGEEVSAVGVRGYLTQFGTTDYSPWSRRRSVTPLTT